MQNLTLQLDSLIADIERLITLTYEDIDLIKNARHAEISRHEHEKTLLIHRFERNKTVLNESLLQITENNPGQPLSDILAAEEQDKLELFKNKLLELHEANKIYGRFVVTLKEFFNSLVSAILPMKQEGYENTQPSPAAFLQVSA